MSLVEFVCRYPFVGLSSTGYNYVRIADPAEDISLMEGADELVEPEVEIEINYTYPLTEPISFTHRREQGFTRADLVRCVSEDYRKIYRDHADRIAGSDYTCDLNYLVLGELTKNGTYQARVFV